MDQEAMFSVWKRPKYQDVFDHHGEGIGQENGGKLVLEPICG